MLVRKFQKENLDDLFAVVRQNPSGMQCLARFAEEQRMGGEVGFFMEVKGETLGLFEDQIGLLPVERGCLALRLSWGQAGSSSERGDGILAGSRERYRGSLVFGDRGW